MKKYLFLIVIATLLTSCASKCSVMDMACRGTMVEICNSDEKWEDVVDCSEIEPLTWTCVEADTDDAYCDLEQ